MKPSLPYHYMCLFSMHITLCNCNYRTSLKNILYLPFITPGGLCPASVSAPLSWGEKVVCFSWCVFPLIYIWGTSGLHLSPVLQGWSVHERDNMCVSLARERERERWTGHGIYLRVRVRVRDWLDKWSREWASERMTVLKTGRSVCVCVRDCYLARNQ